MGIPGCCFFKDYLTAVDSFGEWGFSKTLSLHFFPSVGPPPLSHSCYYCPFTQQFIWTQSMLPHRGLWRVLLLLFDLLIATSIGEGKQTGSKNEEEEYEGQRSPGIGTRSSARAWTLGGTQRDLWLTSALYNFFSGFMV